MGGGWRHIARCIPTELNERRGRPTQRIPLRSRWCVASSTRPLTLLIILQFDHVRFLCLLPKHCHYYYTNKTEQKAHTRTSRSLPCNHLSVTTPGNRLRSMWNSAIGERGLTWRRKPRRHVMMDTKSLGRRLRVSTLSHPNVCCSFHGVKTHRSTRPCLSSWPHQSLLLILL